MKDPQRLLDASATALEQRLLRAGVSEQPPAAAAQRLAEKLGASGASKLAPVAATKLSLVPIGVVAVGITLAGVGWFASRDAAPAQPAAAAPASRLTEAQPAAAAPASRSAEAQSAAAAPASRPVEAQPSAAAPASRPAEAQPAAAAPASHPTETQPAAAAPASPLAEAQPDITNTLALEIARIDAARRFLASARPKPALAALQEYQRDFPGGVLRQEADVLRIEAHGKAGERRRARSLASQFLADHPESPHAARVHDLLDELGADAR
jgi:hypothetical protein